MSIFVLPIHGFTRMRVLAAGFFCCMVVAPSTTEASAQLAGVEFKAGHPVKGESLTDAVKAPEADEEKALEEDATVLKEMPSARVEIVGFTDSTECVERQCYELSLRRARVVYEWLVAHGVSSANLIEPTGHGSEMAIDDNGTERGRQRNRRTEINMVRSDGTPQPCIQRGGLPTEATSSSPCGPACADAADHSAEDLE